MAVGCQTGGVGRGRHISDAGQWPEVSGGLRAPLKATLFSPAAANEGASLLQAPVSSSRL